VSEWITTRPDPCLATLGSHRQVSWLARARADRRSRARPRAGRLHRVGHGLYSTTARPDDLLVANRFGTLSHLTAAALLQLDLLEPPSLHVTAPNHRRSPPRWVKVHRARLAPGEVIVRDGLSLTSPLRTMVDCARWLPPPAAEVLLDSGLRNRAVSQRELATAAANGGGPGSAAVRRSVAMTDPASGSALETLTRVLFHGQGLTPQTQAVIRDVNGFVARVDFLFPGARLVVEVDGFTHHSDRASFRSDRRRQNALLRAGYMVVRFSWEDIVGCPDYVIATVRSLLAGAG
jgi:very-short-patch-repair endonuclease